MIASSSDSTPARDGIIRTVRDGSVASATLRNIYTYIAVDVDETGHINRIMTDKPIGVIINTHSHPDARPWWWGGVGGSWAGVL